jgi:hypothetical protein
MVSFEPAALTSNILLSPQTSTNALLPNEPLLHDVKLILSPSQKRMGNINTRIFFVLLNVSFYNLLYKSGLKLRNTFEVRKK